MTTLQPSVSLSTAVASKTPSQLPRIRPHHPWSRRRTPRLHRMRHRPSATEPSPRPAPAAAPPGPERRLPIPLSHRLIAAPLPDQSQHRLTVGKPASRPRPGRSCAGRHRTGCVPWPPPPGVPSPRQPPQPTPHEGRVRTHAERRRPLPSTGRSRCRPCRT